MSDDLIRDDGEIRQCPANLARMGFFRSLVEFYGYKRAASIVDWGEVWESVLSILNLILFFVLFPVLPLLQCWSDVRRAKKEVAAEQAKHNDHD